MSYGKRNGVKGISHFAVACISIIILLSIVGVGYGYWQNGIEVTNSISTGNMQLDISDCKVYEKIEDKKDAVTSLGLIDDNKKMKMNAVSSVSLSNNNKVMNVTITDAYPGYAVAIQYRITNSGSIPAKCRLVSTYNVGGENGGKSLEIPVELKNSDKSTVTLGVGKSIDGILIININNVGKGQNYNFPINLIFDQYNQLD